MDSVLQNEDNRDVADSMIGEIYDLIKNILDPELPKTLEELDVISENDISVKVFPNCSVVNIELTPTVPHCHLATIIGLCVRTKLEKYWGKQYKWDIFLKEGSHTSAHAVSKQINDKERIAAAMENPDLKKMVQRCISEDDK